MTQQWTANDIPDQSGRVAIVTGSNSGIGWVTADELAKKGATVIMACRSLSRANPAADQIRAHHPAGKVVVMELDLSNLESVKAFVTAFRQQYDRLDLLINNAGVMMTPYGKTTQGFEQQFGVNHLGHFALTGQLLDMLNATPGARVVTISSVMHRWGSINFEDLNSERGYRPPQAYGQSKLANLMFTYELQRRLTAAGQSTLSVAAHPGWTATNLQKNAGLFERLNPILAQKTEMGALPTLYAATAPDVRGGNYYGPGGLMEMRGFPKQVKSSERSKDAALAERLWSVSEDLTHIKVLATTAMA